MKMGGCWIFLSHSSDDIEKVRIIRNEFERCTHNPLAFHLRCLSDETPEKKKELDGLIKREIDCREWFIYCDSPAAAASDYVKMEMDYIRERKKANVWTIDLSLPPDQLRLRVREICRQMNVFVSYAWKDSAAIYESLGEALLAKDYDVWDSACISGPERIAHIFPVASEYGYAVILVTEAYAKSPFCLMELEQLCATNKLILPFYTPTAEIPELLRKVQCFRISSNPTLEEIGRIVDLIDALIELQLGGILHSESELQETISEMMRKFS